MNAAVACVVAEIGDKSELGVTAVLAARLLLPDVPAGLRLDTVDAEPFTTSKVFDAWDNGPNPSWNSK